MIRGLVARFREKGATSPEKAMTAQELGLPPRFEEAMKRRLGATGIFVEVSGKYYMDEEKLKQFQEERRAWGGGMGGSGSMVAIRMARSVVGLAVVVLILVNILFVRSLELSVVVLLLLVLWIAITLYQLLRFSRMRRAWRARGMAGGNTV